MNSSHAGIYVANCVESGGGMEVSGVQNIETREGCYTQCLGDRDSRVCNIIV
jgi:hypothetical protein